MLLDLDRPKAWPGELQAYLNEHRDCLLPGQTGFDEIIGGLMDVLHPYEILGWHCTRLTDTEVDDVLCNGMGLPDAMMLERRIDALVEDDEISPDVARLLKSTNQADEEYRAGRVCFCFFPPEKAGESGIGRFFRHWGGEALYNSHENDPITSPAISGIGTPCIVEADVPAASLRGDRLRLALNVVHRFRVAWDQYTTEATDYEDCIVCPLAAENIRRVIRFPDPDFLILTGCSAWRRPITGVRDCLP